EADGAGEHHPRRAGAVARERVRHLPDPPVRAVPPRRAARGGAHRRCGRGAHLPAGRAATAQAHHRDHRGARLPGLLERLHVAPHRAHRSRHADAAGGARHALTRACAGRRADDGRRGDHHLAGAAALPRPAALLPARPRGGERQGMIGAVLGLVVLADARDAGAWKAIASEQVEAVLRRDADGSLCLEYDFHSVSGYAVMRRPLAVDWPRAFALRVRMKGRGGVNDFQVKLVDASGDNVWWVNRPGYAMPHALTDLTFKSRHFSFAWGPAADKTLTHTEALELAVAAGRDRGKGALCVAQVALEEREADPPVWPDPVVRTLGGTQDVDLVRLREFNGLALQWPAPVRRVSYEVLASSDARAWKVLRRVRRSSGGFDAVYLPESEARHLRIRALDAPAPLRVELRDSRQWPDLNAVLSELARHAPRGHVPRAFLGEQNYWALVGVDGGGARSALLSEDGALEVGRGGFSVEPAVMAEGQLLTWAEVQIDQSLRERHLPMPEVRWRHPQFTPEIAAAGDGSPEAP